MNLKGIGAGIIKKLVEKLTSDDSAAKKIVENITNDIHNNFKKLNADEVVIFIGDKSQTDYGYKNGYGVFPINKNDLLKITGIPGGLLTFERFGAMFSDVENTGVFLIRIFEVDGVLVMGIFRQENGEKVEYAPVLEKPLSSFISDAISGMAENKEEIESSISGIVDNIQAAEVTENE